MWLFILLISLVCVTGFAILLCNADVLEPLPLSMESFLLSTLIAFCYNGFSGTDISGFTVFIVITALLVYMAGYVAVKVIMQSGGFIGYSNREREFRSPGKKLSGVLFMIELLAVADTFRATLSIARMRNSGAGLLNMLEYARNAYLFTDASMGVFASILSFYVMAISYFYTFVIISCVVKEKKIKIKSFLRYKLELVMIAVSLLSGMLGTGRTFLIKYIVFLFITFYYLRLARERTRRLSIRKLFGTMKKMVLAVAIFFVLFQLMGIFTNKTGNLSAKDMLYGYSGAAVVALDKSIETYEYDGRFFGEESFYGLYGFMNAFGFHLPNDILHLPFVGIGGGNRTNIYTSLRTYLYDFGFLGMYVVQLLLGAISAYMYGMMFRLKRHPVFMLVYGILIYGIAMQGIAEITLRNFMSITNVFITLFFTIFYIISQRKIRIK